MTDHKISHSLSIGINPLQTNLNAAFFCVFRANEKLSKSPMQTKISNNFNMVHMFSNKT